MEADLRKVPIDTSRSASYGWYASNPTSPDGVVLKILLADDNEQFRRRLCALLQRESAFELVGDAADGEEVVRLARELKPDVVIIDVVMPRLNGIGATRRITSEFPSIQVIALSMHGDAGFRIAMLEAGASIYILKDNVFHELPKVLGAIAAGFA